MLLNSIERKRFDSQFFFYFVVCLLHAMQLMVTTVNPLGHKISLSERNIYRFDNSIHTYPIGLLNEARCTFGISKHTHRQRDKIKWQTEELPSTSQQIGVSIPISLAYKQTPINISWLAIWLSERMVLAQNKIYMTAEVNCHSACTKTARPPFPQASAPILFFRIFRSTNITRAPIDEI